MKMLTTGLIAGGIIGAAGLTYAVADRRIRKRVMENGSDLVKKLHM